MSIETAHDTALQSVLEPMTGAEPHFELLQLPHVAIKRFRLALAVELERERRHLLAAADLEEPRPESESLRSEAHALGRISRRLAP